jgi:hypothetical protein
MILINFAHPITSSQMEQIESLLGQSIHRVLEINSQIDVNLPLAPQITQMADAVGLTPIQWQTEPILINTPSLNYSALLLLVELHGRMGYFPPIIRIRPVSQGPMQKFEVAEIINLQSLRENARQTRNGA